MTSPFHPKPGQVDYTNIRWVPVINCVVRHGEKILLVKRSDKVGWYPGYWNGISGFLDDHRSLEQTVKDELAEEVGIPASAVTTVTLGPIFHHDQPEQKKTWIVHPILVDVTTGEVKRDWESQEHAWVSPNNARSYQLMPGFADVLTILGL